MPVNIEYVGIDPLSGDFNRYNGIKGDSENLPFENESFDMTIMNDILDHVYDPVKSISEACRVLKNNGYLYISNEINASRLDHTINFKEEDLTNLITHSNFTIEEVALIDFGKITFMAFTLKKEIR